MCLFSILLGLGFSMPANARQPLRCNLLSRRDLPQNKAGGLPATEAKAHET